MSVKQYMPVMVEVKNGYSAYVTYEDYQKLEARISELEKELEQYRSFWEIAIKKNRSVKEETSCELPSWQD